MINTVIFCLIVYSVFSLTVTGIGIADVVDNVEPDTAMALVFRKIGVHWMA